MKQKLILSFILSFFSLFCVYNVVSASLPNSKVLLEILNDLNVAPNCENPKYSRKDWKHWIDADRDGQKARDEVLISESLISVELSSNGKKVVGGRWYCPFTDRVYTKPSDLQIDHFVPLSEAHRSAGCKWSKAKRKRYANFLTQKEELIAVYGPANNSKGDKDPSKWLPDNTGYHCEYVSNWLIIKDRWNLHIDENEKKAIRDIINNKCSR